MRVLKQHRSFGRGVQRSVRAEILMNCEIQHLEGSESWNFIGSRQKKLALSHPLPNRPNE